MDYFKNITVKYVEGETALQVAGKKAVKIMHHIQILLKLNQRNQQNNNGKRTNSD